MASRRILSSLLLAASTFAAQAPLDRPWRSLGMGGAGVAVVDDADAVHLNPAGLTQLGRDEFRPLDSLGYKRDRFDIWIAGVAVDPSPERLLDLNRFVDRHRTTIDKATDEDPLFLVKDQKLLDGLYEFDQEPIRATGTGNIAVAFRNFGAAVWTRDEAVVTLDHGAITPKGLIRLTSTSGVELATSQAFADDRLSLGFGYRVVARSVQQRQYDALELQDEGAESVYRLVRQSGTKLLRTEDWGHGFDLGALWFQTPSLRLAGSLRDVGMRLDDRFVTPDLTAGLAWAPQVLQSRGAWARRVNLGLALENLLYDTLGYKPLSKLNLGAEIQQTAIPGFLKLGLSGGFKGGYPAGMVSTTLFSWLRCDLLTYAEETGYFTGDRPDRVWMGRVGVGL
jgi:hypothetical protein